MQKWARSLEYIPRADSELDDQEKLIDAFCRTDNLKLLWLLERSRFEQVAVARAALEIASHRRVTDAEATTARDNWYQEIRDAHGGTDFDTLE